MSDDTPDMLPDESASGGAPEPEYLLPDGVGLSLDDVRMLLAKKHDLLVSRDDSILLTVTMLNAYLGEMEKLNARHGKALTRLLADKTDAYVGTVRQATDQLAASLSTASVEGIRKIFDEHAAGLIAFRANINLVAAVIAVSALVNVAALVALRWMR